tara:strand:- start:113098 stop:114876 length:1779 start_codon:yes stop_codon:yes gene_type:complete
MEEEVKGLDDYLNIIVRRKYLVIIPALILIVASAAVAYLLPPTYKSEGLILIESQEIPTDLIRSTVTSYADQRIQVIKQRLMTTSKVMAMVKKYNLYPDLRQKSPPSELVDLFRQSLGVEMVEANVTDPQSGRGKQATIAFRVSFMDKSPQMAQIVANDLVTEFLNENVRTRTSRASETKDFLKDEGDKFEIKVQELEKKIADFKDEYSDSLPELLEYNLSMVTNLQQELADNQNQSMVLQDQIMTMSLEIGNLQPYLETPIPVVGGQKTPTTEQQLQLAQSEYNSLSAKYSDQHPDVIQLKRQIDNLQSELGFEPSEVARLTTELQQAEDELKQAKQRYSDEHPDVKSLTSRVDSLNEQLKSAEASPSSSPSNAAALSKDKRQINPIYLQIKSKIDSSEREIVRLRNRQKEVQLKLTSFENRIYKTHQVKRAYDDLTRDHANNLAKYKELRAKQLEAELGQNLESENKGESFSLIEPPLVPSKAEKPNRKKILLMGVVASIGSGIGIALLVEILFGGLRGYKETSRVMGRAPLVVLPIITTEQDIIKRRRLRNRILFLLVILLALMVAAFHIWVMNLEVLWFKVLNKISLL